MVDRTVLQCDLFKYNVTMAPTPITDYTVMLIRMIPARNRPWIADSFENIFNLEISFLKKIQKLMPSPNGKAVTVVQEQLQSGLNQTHAVDQNHTTLVIR